MASKDFSTSQRNTIWEKYFGTKSSATDIFGRNMTIEDFECDHILPKAKGGVTTIENGIPLNSQSNQEKADDLKGRINGRRFEVMKKSNNTGNIRVNNVQQNK